VGRKQRKNSIAPGKDRITFDDDSVVLDKLDAWARREGITRADIMRRAVRFLLAAGPDPLSLTGVPINGSGRSIENDQPSA
jgi:hypothetical protein